jgi:hypothetical protein
MIDDDDDDTQVYKKPWVGLTDAEVDNIVAYPWGETKNWIKAIENKLKEKNNGFS